MSTTKTKEKEDVRQVTLDEALTKDTTSLATVKPHPVTTHEATGFEDFTQDDLMVPFLVILQKGNPQVEEGNAKQIPGAKASQIMNTVSNELFDAVQNPALPRGRTGVTVIPVHRVHNYLEWIPRDDGGGLQGVYDWQDPLVVETKKKAGKKFGKLKVNDNNDLVETFNVFCIQILPNGTRKRIVLGFSSSQIPAYKKWMTNAMEQTKTVADGSTAPRPLWSHRYRVTTVFTQKKGNSWFKFDVAFDGATAEDARYADDDAVQKEAKEFRELLMSGAAQANFDTVVQEDESTGDEFEM